MNFYATHRRETDYAEVMLLSFGANVADKSPMAVYVDTNWDTWVEPLGDFIKMYEEVPANGLATIPRIIGGSVVLHSLVKDYFEAQAKYADSISLLTFQGRGQLLHALKTAATALRLAVGWRRAA